MARTRNLRIINLWRSSKRPAAPPPLPPRPIDRNVFRFFDLPQELCDFIYAYSIDDTPLEQLACTDDQDLVVRARNVPRTNLLILNREFQRQYQKAFEEPPVLEIFDLSIDTPWHGDLLELPHLAPPITPLTVHLYCDSRDDKEYESKQGPEGMSTMDCHLVWLVELLRRLPQLRTLTVKVYARMRWTDTLTTSGLDQLKIDLAPWLGLRALQSIKLYDTRYTHGEEDHPSSVEVYERLTTPRQLKSGWNAKSRRWENLDNTSDEDGVNEPVNGNEVKHRSGYEDHEERAINEREYELMEYTEKLRMIVKNEDVYDHRKWPSNKYWRSFLESECRCYECLALRWKFDCEH